MAAQTGTRLPVGRIVTKGAPMEVIHKKVETITGLKPGVLVKKGTTADDIVVNDGVSVPTGIFGYEDTDEAVKKDSITTAPVANERHSVIRGGAFQCRMYLQQGFEAEDGDLAVPWADGTLAVGAIVNGKLCIKVPFEKKTTEFDTTIDFIAGQTIHLPYVKVDTNGATTMDVGLLTTENGGTGDIDGLVDGISLAAAGWASHVLADSTTGNRTSGDLLEDGVVTADTGALYASVILEPGYKIASNVSLVYIVNDDVTVAGWIYVPVSAEGFRSIGTFAEAKSKSLTADQAVMVNVNWG